jgi:hypothetical protein
MIEIFVILSFALIVLMILSIYGPPFLLIAIGFQFIQVSIRVFQSLLTGESLGKLAQFGVDLEPAILLAASGLAFMTFGIWLVARKPSIVGRSIHQKPLGNKQIILVAIVALVAGHVLDVMQWVVPAAQQLLLGLAGLKHIGLFLLVWIAIKDAGSRALAGAVVAFELLLGVMGFFGEFRLVFYVVFGAVLASGVKFNARIFVPGVIVGLCAVLMAIFWSHTKVGYRAFLNQGTDAQIVLVPMSERLDYLGNAFMTFGASEFQDGLERLVDRITYVDHLAVVLARVPAIIPHANGERSGAAVLHVLVPRLFYPSKPPLQNDTEATNFYTGLHDNWQDGTSISMGYLTELYIDFGWEGALLIMFIIGLVFGNFYKTLRDYPLGNLILNHSFCMVMVLPFAVFETALVKLFGSLIVVFISMIFLQRFGIPFLLRKLSQLSISATSRPGR